MATKTPSSAGSLSSGREFPWKRSKPSLLADEEATGIVAPAEEHFSPGKFFQVSAKAIIAILVFGFLLVTACWMIFGLTVLPVMRIGDGIWAVKWSAWPTGKAPREAVVATAGNEIDRGLPGRFAYLIGSNPQDSVQRIIGIPGDTVSTDSTGHFVIQGVTTKYVIDDAISEYKLSDSYLMYCITGACSAYGEYNETPTNRVMGEVLKQYSPPISLRAPPVYEEAGN